MAAEAHREDPATARTPAAADGSARPDAPALPYSYEADAACVLAVRAGQQERFEELVERYQKAVYAVTLSYIKDAQRAEDLAQEVFVNAFTNLAQLREPNRFFPWLLQIARNRSYREAQRSSARPEQPLGEGFDPPAPGADPDAQRVACVFALVEELEEPYRTTLLCKYQQGLSCKEIAEREGVPIGTITSRLTRALAVLRTALGQSS
ncbi:MAG: sigma-70 family RNA polymerase sigma factor [Planctomycetota bacterium]|nr:sigma-70 family RNA polymerase sigma factor [Planctomycetota bacterium]